jgi:hypothetical protein
LKALLVFAATLTAHAGPALADIRLEPAFAGVIVSTYPDGRTARLWLNRDGTYTAEGRRRKPSSGVWAVEDERICLRQRRPFPGPFSYCQPIPSGPAWRGKAPTGEPIDLRLTPGGRR